MCKHMADQGFTSRKYKEHLPLNYKKKKNSIKNGQIVWTDTFSKNL